MDRQYLYVPYEEGAEVQKLGAHWDTRAKGWYLEPQDDPSRFERWLMPDTADADGEEQYLIESDRAYVACATAHCQRCAAQIEVITIFCVQGALDGEPLEDFSVMRISAVDDALGAQLTLWPFFRKKASLFCNHCSHCGAPQQDIDLHCEPDGVFVHMDAASREAMTLTPLDGRIRLNGEETFEA
jgi:hypothetical protein